MIPTAARAVEQTKRSPPAVAELGQRRRARCTSCRWIESESSGDGSAGKAVSRHEEALAAAKPGDLLLLHAGEYGGRHSNQPVSRRERDRRASTRVHRLEGRGRWRRPGSTSCGPAAAVWFEGLTFQRTDEADGLRADGDCENVVVRGCTFRGYHYAILLSRASRRWYIADNDIIGDTARGIAGEGVELNHSPDHTVCYNRIAAAPTARRIRTRNCDIFANDIFDVTDDRIEPDYGYANIRIWGNRLDGRPASRFSRCIAGRGISCAIRSFRRAMCSSSACKTATWWRTTPSPRWTTPVPHAHGLLTAMTRNNIWIHGGGSEFLWVSNAPDNEKNRSYSTKFVLFDATVANWKTDVDYDGFEFSAASPHPKLKPPTQNPWMWINQRFFDLSSLSAAIGIEAHGRVLDRIKDFEPFAMTREMPGKDAPLIQIAASGQAKDAGVALPNIAEEFDGKSPDLGAFEAGGRVPHFGPRDDPDAVPMEWSSSISDDAL